MRSQYYYLSCFLFISLSISAQTNLTISNSLAKEVLQDNYDAEDYVGISAITDPHELVQTIQSQISADSLKEYIIKLSTFGNRNTGSDTLSETWGIGAARRWIFSKFVEFSGKNEDRLLPSYFIFDQSVCGMNQHRNVLGVLPGTAEGPHEIIIIEGHMDSRCNTGCDINCPAEGVEDNASGTALVIELARVMSALNFDQTIVFMATTGEEQGLLGADALALYAEQNNLPIKSVLNNDVIGGIACGETSSPPSCPSENHIDSTQVRLFSAGNFNSPAKALCRFIKMQYEQELVAQETVPMAITLMSAEDRTGRGGDHIPFRERGFTAMRFTSANEHGDASNGPDYHDRQHTSDDILGIDTDGDELIDSFFVDFNYLSRNAKINGASAALISQGPKRPSIAVAYTDGDQFYIEVEDPMDYNKYMIGYRTGSLDFDTTYFITGSKADHFETPKKVQFIYLSVASIDENGIESLFSEEVLEFRSAVEDVTETAKEQNIRLLQNRPNPFDEATTISVFVNEPFSFQKAEIIIRDLQGIEVDRFRTQLEKGMNETLYRHGYGHSGAYVYSLVVDGLFIASKQMIFAY